MSGTEAVTVDARGLSCPMPIVKARQAMKRIPVGEVLEVLATDPGAPADFRAWCRQTEQRFLELREEGDLFRIRLQKVLPEVEEKHRLYDREMTNEELARRLEGGGNEDLVVLDVREAEEFAAGHVPGAIHIPVDRLPDSLEGRDRSQAYALICRNGRRSGYACQIMEQNGFQNLWNVVPGMVAWKGPVNLPGRSPGRAGRTS